MPDTDRLVSEWRLSMAAHFSGREEVLDELEDHLRDVIEELTDAGTPPERAFPMAAARLGLPTEIAAEFAKVPPPPRAVAPGPPGQGGWPPAGPCPGLGAGPRS